MSVLRSVFLSLLLAYTAKAAAQPLPADPLSTSESSQAVSIAQSGGQQAGLLHTGVYTLVGVELVVSKDPSAPSPSTAHRQASVLFYRSDSNDGLRVLVDLATGQMQASATVQSGSVPIGIAEVNRAAALALNDPNVRALLGSAASTYHVGIAASDQDNTIEALRAFGTDATDPCFQQRCAELFFRNSGDYLAGNRITVNLSAGTVQVTNTNTTATATASMGSWAHRRRR